MVKTILTGAGFIEDETFKETRFLSPPKTTYAIYNNSVTKRGADNKNLITERSLVIELYAYKIDRDAESNIENMLDTLGIEYEKSERYWLETEQLYETVYTFNIIEK